MWPFIEAVHRVTAAPFVAGHSVPDYRGAAVKGIAVIGDRALGGYDLRSSGIILGRWEGGTWRDR